MGVAAKAWQIQSMGSQQAMSHIAGVDVDSGLARRCLRWHVVSACSKSARRLGATRCGGGEGPRTVGVVPYWHWERNHSSSMAKAWLIQSMGCQQAMPHSTQTCPESYNSMFGGTDPSRCCPSSVRVGEPDQRFGEQRLLSIIISETP